MAFSLTGPSTGYDPGFTLPTATLPKTPLPSLKAPTSAAGGPGGLLSGVTGVLGGIGSALTGGLGSAITGLMGGPDAPSNAVSGTGTFSPGGINVGSKVVGSGSAATTFPSASEGRSLLTSNSAVAGMALPPWAVPVGIAVALVFAWLLFAPRRKK